MGCERETFRKLKGKPRLDFIELDVAAEKLFERGGFAVSDATGNDEIEEAEIGGDVVGKTVGGDPAADVDTDGSEFFFRDSAGWLDPDAGFAGDTKGRDAEVRGSTNHGFFERADVPVHVAADAIEIEDGVTDDLAGPMIGDIAAAVRFPEFDAFLAQDVFRREQIFRTGVATERKHVGVLAEEQNIVNGAGFARCDEALLESECDVPAANADVGDEKLLCHWSRKTDIGQRAEESGAARR